MNAIKPGAEPNLSAGRTIRWGLCVPRMRLSIRHPAQAGIHKTHRFRWSGGL